MLVGLGIVEHLFAWTYIVPAIHPARTYVRIVFGWYVYGSLSIIFHHMLAYLTYHVSVSIFNMHLTYHVTYT